MNKAKPGRPIGRKRGSITLSLPLEIIEWLRKTKCSSQIVEDLVKEEMSKCP